MDLKLTNKLALVTASTAGIGHAIAVALAREGARVIVNGRTRAAVDAAVAGIKSATGADILGFAVDLGTAAAADERMAKTAPARACTSSSGAPPARPKASATPGR